MFGIDTVAWGLDYLNNLAHNSKQIQKEASSEWMINAAYNTPANQVARLREAGLNPNLAYGAVNTGNMSGASTRSSAAEHDTGFSRAMDFLSGLVSLSQAIGGEKRADAQLELAKREQDLDSLKFLSSLEHQQDALELERLRMIELANSRERDYQLRREALDFKKATYQPRQDSATTLLNNLFSNVIGKRTTDVATDTHNLLEKGFHYATAPVAYSQVYLPRMLESLLKGIVKNASGSGIRKN